MSIWRRNWAVGGLLLFGLLILFIAPSNRAEAATSCPSINNPPNANGDFLFSYLSYSGSGTGSGPDCTAGIWDSWNYLVPAPGSQSRDGFLFALPDTNTLAYFPTTGGAKARFIAGNSGVSTPSTVSVINSIVCTGASISLSISDTLAEIELTDGQQCSLEVDLKLNGASMIYVSTLSRDGATYSLAAGSVTLADSTAPSATIDAPTSFAGTEPFTATFTFDEDISGFDLSDINAGLSNATATVFGTTTASRVFTATITPTGAGDVTIRVLKDAVQDTAGNKNELIELLVGNTTVEDTQKIIASFMLNRANHLLGNQPNLGSFLNGGNGAGGALGNLALNGNEGGMELAFSTSLSQIDRAETKAINDRIALAFVKKEGAKSGEGTQAIEAQTIEAMSAYDGVPKRRYDIWAEIYGSQGSSASSDSSLWVGYLGAHYFVTPDLIIGGLAQFDWADESDVTVGSSIDGSGWMIGPYMAGRIAGTSIAYEARAAWGRSDNNVSPYGTYTDSFGTERWLASGKISGSFMIDDIKVKPTMEASYFHETQSAYVDSLTNVIPEQAISLGQLRFGPEFSRAIKLDNGNTIEPSLGIAGVWNFGVTGDADPSGFALGNADLRARVDGGITMTNAMGWRLTAAAYYDGLGIAGYEALGGNVRLSIPLN